MPAWLTAAGGTRVFLISQFIRERNPAFVRKGLGFDKARTKSKEDKELNQKIRSNLERGPMNSPPCLGAHRGMVVLCKM